MTRFRLSVALILLWLCPAFAEDGDRVVFEATVSGVEPWRPIKISCGLMAIYRLAEYKLNAVYKGGLNSEKVILEHLACSYNELSELNAGDKVIVVAEKLPRAENKSWMHDPWDDRQSDERVVVQYRGNVAVAKH